MCGEGPGDEEPSGDGEPDKTSSWYRGAIHGEHGEVPFYLRLPGPDEEGEVEILNGSARITAEHRWHGSEVTISFRHWGTSLEVEKLASGELDGVWVASRLFNQFEAPFTATPAPEPDPRRRFPGQATAEADIDGSWRTELSRSGPAELRLRSIEPGVVEGTIVQRGGDSDFGALAGNVRGDELRLSVFDGQRAIRLSARVGGGQMAGEWESVGVWSERFMAVRGEVDEEASVVAVGEHNRRVDVQGLDDPRYEGKPVIIKLFGTWCTTCGDLAPVIRDFHDRYRDQGLEVHAVAYEVVDDEDYIERQIAAYREHYGIEWPIVVVPGEVAPQLPPELRDIDVLPITLFRNPDGTLHAIRTGFVSEASGEEHARRVAEFEELTRAIIGADS
jgi:thiol-disulfide isomerase/thioredoxin